MSHASDIAETYPTPPVGPSVAAARRQHTVTRDQLLDVLVFTAAEDLEQRCEVVRGTRPALRQWYRVLVAEQSVDVMAALVKRHEKELTA